MFCKDIKLRFVDVPAGGSVRRVSRQRVLFDDQGRKVFNELHSITVGIKGGPGGYVELMADRPEIALKRKGRPVQSGPGQLVLSAYRFKTSEITVEGDG